MLKILQAYTEPIDTCTSMDAGTIIHRLNSGPAYVFSTPSHRSMSPPSPALAIAPGFVLSLSALSLVLSTTAWRSRLSAWSPEVLRDPMCRLCAERWKHDDAADALPRPQRPPRPPRPMPQRAGEAPRKDPPAMAPPVGGRSPSRSSPSAGSAHRAAAGRADQAKRVRAPTWRSMAQPIRYTLVQKLSFSDEIGFVTFLFFSYPRPSLYNVYNVHTPTLHPDTRQRLG